MKTVILGSGGTLGRQLLEVFKDDRIMAPTRKELDISNAGKLASVLEDFGPELIINAAAYNNVDGAEEEDGYKKAIAINSEVPESLALIASKISATLVHFSTDYVFDGSNKNGYEESSITNPISNYGRSKMLGEQAALASCAKSYVIRLSRLFGLMGTSPGSKKSFVDLMLELGKIKPELKITDDKINSPTYSLDLALRVKFIVDNKYPFGIYHAANSDSCSFFEFAKEIFAYAGLNPKTYPVSSSEFPRPARIPDYSVLINTKLPPMRPWQEALKEYINST